MFTVIDNKAYNIESIKVEFDIVAQSLSISAERYDVYNYFRKQSEDIKFSIKKIKEVIVMSQDTPYITESLNKYLNNKTSNNDALILLAEESNKDSLPPLLLDGLKHESNSKYVIGSSNCESEETFMSEVKCIEILGEDVFNNIEKIIQYETRSKVKEETKVKSF